MAVNRYSLADYELHITFPEDIGITGITGQEFILGGPAEKASENGEGGFIGNITVRRNAEAWSLEGDYTGGWVFNQNLNKTGEVSVSLNQVSDNTLKLIQLCSIYQSTDIHEGLSLELYSNAEPGSPICVCTDCRIQKLPDAVHGENADRRDWVFLCGKIEFNY